jgi:hypothetical protein
LETKRVFYISYQPYAFEYAKILHKDLGWEPVLWNVRGDFAQTVKKEFPQVLTQHHNDAMKGKLPDFLKEEELNAVDATLLKSMAYHESVALNMMNRNYLTDVFLYQERFRLYHRILSLYLTLLNKLKPDVVIFEDTPHLVNEYILYSLCQQKNIKTILFETTPLIKYFSPMHRFEEGYIKLAQAYIQSLAAPMTGESKISEASMEEIMRVRGSYSKAIPYYMVDQVKDFNKTKSKSVFTVLSKFLLLTVKIFNLAKFKKRFHFILSLNQPSEHNYYKLKNIPLEDAVITNGEYLKQVKQVAKQKKNNLDYYRSIEQKNPDLDIPFIFCPLHFQPEKSTTPWGGYYTNQLLMIELLSRSVPTGWKIYVKDHITQYIYPATGEPSRDRSFYDDVRKLKNVEFISLDLKAFDLIDKATAVASIAGRALWESVVRGKPALAFGEGYHCWGGGCEGIFYVPDAVSLKTALQKIQSGYPVNFDHILLYARAIEKYCYKGYAGGTFLANNSELTVEENGKAHADAIKDLMGVEVVSYS